ncbi:MAG: hypothetical protein GX791_04090 [Synergistaceae bacterium]|nr:hypothetical protein [Synergistaceae bacterium]
MDDARSQSFASPPAYLYSGTNLTEVSDVDQNGPRLPARKQPVLLLLACVVVAFLLFSPRPALTSSQALQLAKDSRDLSPEVSNEKFIEGWKDVAAAKGGPKWDVDPFPGSGYIVSCLYKDSGGDFKGWFFEIFARERVARRVTRSLGDVYSQRIDDIFFRYSLDLTEDEMMTFSLEEEKLPLEGLLRAILEKYGNTAEDVENRFGPPRTLRRKNMTSIHDESYKYAIVTLTWPGLALAFFQAPDKESLVSVMVLDDTHPFGPQPGIRVGMPFDSVLKILGEPADKEGRTAVYRDDEGFYDLIFDLERSGDIKRMKFLVYMD